MLNLFLKKNKLFHLNKCYHQFSSSSLIKDIWVTTIMSLTYNDFLILAFKFRKQMKQS